jgi:hypothetical protein
MGPMAMSNETARSRFATDEERWDAVVRRDRATDGTFYYSVRVTVQTPSPESAARDGGSGAYERPQPKAQGG